MSRSAEKSVYIGTLLDFYGSLLSPRQREIATLYYNEDLSLAEVAELLSITRQGVRDGLLKAEMLLSDYEEKLHLLEKMQQRDACLSALIDRLRKVGDEGDAPLLARAQALLESD